MEYDLSRMVLWRRAGVLAASISKPQHATCNCSEKLWYRSGGDWGIGHAEKSQEA